MKGASDGGLYVPHSPTRFPGFKEGEENKKLRSRILGGHIDDYMKALKGSDKAALQFSQWTKTLKDAGVASVEKLYEIRKSPGFTKKAAKQNPTRDQKKFKRVRLTGAKRKENVKKRIEIRLKELKKQKK